MSFIKTSQFTQAQGLEVQRDQLEQSKRLYKPDVYEALVAYVKEENKKLDASDDGYVVLRGTYLDNFCINWARNNAERV